MGLGLFYLFRNNFIAYYYLVVLLVIAYLAPNLIALIKWKKIPTVHLFSNKAALLSVVSFTIFTLIQGFNSFYFAVVVFLMTVSGVESSFFIYF